MMAIVRFAGWRSPSTAAWTALPASPGPTSSQLADPNCPPGKSRADLLGRFHVRELGAVRGSDWHVGVDAFARIWRELPGFRLFHWIFAVPGIRQLAQIAYLGFIRWQARRRAREAFRAG